MKQDVEQEIYDILANEIAREMDEGIISNMLVNSGWIPVGYHFKNNTQAVDINIWLAGTCKGSYRRLGSDYLFENKQDAEWFILRWS